MPIDVTVPANVPWTDTGVLVEEGKEIRVTYLSGEWTANPKSSSGYNANGFDGPPARSGYVVPDVNEGGLVGKVGERTFWIGMNGVVRGVGSGNLFLGINDDQNREYGDGYVDNQGELIVRIVVSDAAVPAVSMFVDADRNGTLTSQALEDWTQGPSSRGAILIPNESGSAVTRVSTPLVFRIEPSAAQPVRGRIEVDDPARIRVLAAGSDGAQPAVVLGQASPENLIAHEFDLVGEEVQFAMEATRYLRREDENPFVTLTFTPLVDGAAGVAQRARLRVAPWLMMHHGDAPERVYVAAPGPQDAAFRQTVDEAQVPIQAIAVAGENDSVFVQDGVEIGYARASAQQVKVQGLRSPVTRWSARMTTEALDFDVIQVEDPVDNRETGPAFGNLEVTPPIGTDGLGRIYFSPNIGPWHTAFLNAQRVQRPFLLDASWLAVGHVDEVVCFLPLPGQRAVALVPSPRLAYRLICETALRDLSANLLAGRTVATIDNPNKPAQQSLKNFLQTPAITGVDEVSLGSDDDEAGNFNAERLGEFAKALTGPTAAAEYATIRDELARGPFDAGSVQGRLQETVIDVITRTFPTPANSASPSVEIVEVPVLFYSSKMKPDALTANLVNLLVLGTRCLFPRPFGPVVNQPIQVTSDLGAPIAVPRNQDVFEVYMKAVLARFGFTGTAIDTWDQYHQRHGEIHCATNVKRTPGATLWWTLPGPE